MAANPQYVAALDLQEVFRDKDTGLPLAAGVINFYQDNARATAKEVFKISGSPPNYSYISIGSEITLSAAGTIVDGAGNQITLYYYPYNADGDVERYYVTCESAGGASQWTRVAWPPGISEGAESSADYENYIPNGQFKIHNNLPVTPTYEAGEVRAADTEIAAGGWRFIRSTASGPKDLVKFERIGSSGTAFANDPRYAVRIECDTPDAGQSRKDLAVRFRDVNKFSSTTNQYTFGFEGIDNNGGTLAVELILRKNYGTGGDSPTETTLTTFTVNSAYNFYDHAFSFGVNDGKIIGADDDDFVELALRFPLDAQFDVSTSNFVLTFGNINVQSFPIETEAETQAIANVGWLPVPDYDGYNIGLPLMQGKAGLYFDDGFVGSFIYTAATTASFGELPCDGTKYEYADYSSDGIPYKRLGDKWWDSATRNYIFGTGYDYMTAIYDQAGTATFIECNTRGAVTAASDGSTATGFTFTNTSPGDDYGVTAYWRGGGVAQVSGDTDFQPLAFSASGNEPISAGDSDYSVEIVDLGYKNPATDSPRPENGSSTIYAFDATLDNTPSKYIEAELPDGVYYIWRTVDGTGTDPALADKTGIKVPLLSTDIVSLRAQKHAAIITGKKTTNIVYTAASAITAGAFFTINTTGAAFYVWYEKAGAGTDPKPSGRISIKVALTGDETGAEVAEKTAIAINRKYFATPDAAGMFIRIWDNGVGRDVFSEERYSGPNPLISGDAIGTYEDDKNHSHFHDIVTSLSSAGTENLRYTTQDPGAGPIEYIGLEVTGPAVSAADDYSFSMRAHYDSEYFRSFNESRPKNIALNIFVKY